MMTGVVYLAIVAVGIVSLVHDPTTGVPGWYGLFMALPVFAISAILLLPIVRDRVDGQLQTLALAILGFIYIGWMFGHFAFLANAANAYGYLLYLLFAVELNDVAAFTCGKLFGRHPLRRNDQPQKDLGRFVGALAVSMVLPWLLHFSFPHFGPLQCILTGLIVGIGGQLGDLSISVIKRDIGVKDMGSADPRPRRNPGSHRQPDLRRPAVSSHDALLLRPIIEPAHPPFSFRKRCRSIGARFQN